VTHFADGNCSPQIVVRQKPLPLVIGDCCVVWLLCGVEAQRAGFRGAEEVLRRQNRFSFFECSDVCVRKFGTLSVLRMPTFGP